MARFRIRRCLRTGLGSLSGLALGITVTVSPAAATLEVRAPETGIRYVGDLTRAYAPCLAPNDVTLDAQPACSPAVTSACTFDRGDVSLRPRGTQTLLDVNVLNLAGPGSCATGPYTLQLGLRITAEDSACAGGQCTFEDVVITPALSFDPPNDQEIANAIIEDLLPTELVGLHYEILGATVIAPDGLPMAAPGLGTNSASSVFAEMGAGYAACTTPNTSGDIGAACSPTVWPSGCDTNAGVLRWRASKHGNPSLQPSFTKLQGLSPDCLDGTYVTRSQLRVTTTCTSTLPCTAVDTAASIPVTAKKGKIDSQLYPVSATGFVNPITSMEVRGIDVDDPSGDLFATTAISSALLLRKPKVTLARHDLADSNDDEVKIEARFPQNGIDPTAPPGVTFTVNDRNGTVYEVNINQGLWQLVAPIGTRWEFIDQGGGVGGVRKATIKQFKEGGEAAGYKIKLNAKGVDLSAADLPGVNLLISIPPPGGFSVLTAQRNRTCRMTAHVLSCK